MLLEPGSDAGRVEKVSIVTGQLSHLVITDERRKADCAAEALFSLYHSLGHLAIVSIAQVAQCLLSSLAPHFCTLLWVRWRAEFKDKHDSEDRRLIGSLRLRAVSIIVCVTWLLTLLPCS